MRGVIVLTFLGGILFGVVALAAATTGSGLAAAGLFVVAAGFAVIAQCYRL